MCLLDVQLDFQYMCLLDVQYDWQYKDKLFESQIIKKNLWE